MYYRIINCYNQYGGEPGNIYKSTETITLSKAISILGLYPADTFYAYEMTVVINCNIVHCRKKTGNNLNVPNKEFFK